MIEQALPHTILAAARPAATSPAVTSPAVTTADATGTGTAAAAATATAYSTTTGGCSPALASVRRYAAVHAELSIAKSRFRRLGA